MDTMAATIVLRTHIGESMAFFDLCHRAHLSCISMEKGHGLTKTPDLVISSLHRANLSALPSLVGFVGCLQAESASSTPMDPNGQFLHCIGRGGCHL